MNREIKFEYGFRAINEIIKKTYFLHEIPDIESKCDVWGDLEIVYVRQFTGLKDKNGKDIYEGDILDDNIIVIWRKDLASFALKKDGWMYDHYFGEAVDPGNTEIIGNIHQNPDLL